MPTNLILPGDIIASSRTSRYPGIWMSQPLSGDARQFSAVEFGLANAAVSVLVTATGAPVNTLILTQYTTYPWLMIYPLDGSAAAFTPAAWTSSSTFRASKVEYAPDFSELFIGLLGSPYFHRLSLPTYALSTSPAAVPSYGCIGASYSPDGRYLAVGMNGTASPGYLVYDRLANMAVVSGLPTVAGPINSVRFLADSRSLVVIARNAPSVMVDVVSKTTIFSSFPSQGNRGAADGALSPDGSKFFVPLPYSTISIWNTADWTRYDDGSAVLPTTNNNYINRVEWIGNGCVVTHEDSSNIQQRIKVWDVTTPTPMILGSPIGAAWDTVSFSVMPGGGLFKFAGIVNNGATTYLERKIRAVDRATGRNLGETMSLPDGSFSLPVFSPRPAILYCVGENGETTQLADDVTPVPY